MGMGEYVLCSVANRRLINFSQRTENVEFSLMHGKYTFYTIFGNGGYIYDR